MLGDIATLTAGEMISEEDLKRAPFLDLSRKIAKKKK